MIHGIHQPLPAEQDVTSYSSIIKFPRLTPIAVLSFMFFFCAPKNRGDRCYVTPRNKQNPTNGITVTGH